MRDRGHLPHIWGYGSKLMDQKSVIKHGIRFECAVFMQGLPWFGCEAGCDILS